MGTVEKTRCHRASLKAGARFSNPNELKIPNLKLKLEVRINAHGKKSWNPTRTVRLVTSLSQASPYEAIFLPNWRKLELALIQTMNSN